MRNKTYRIALGGILSATVLALMFIGSFIPFGTFAVPAAASVIIAIICEEDTPYLAVGVWLTVGILSVLLAADKEAAALFICFFGHYPMLKRLFERRLPKPLAFAAKSASFILSVCGAYWIMLRVFVVKTVRAEFAEYTKGFSLLLMALAFIVFIMLDMVLSRAAVMWRRVLRPRFLPK